MFEARDFTAEDYKTFGQWLEVRGRMVPRLEYLPKTGVVIEDIGAENLSNRPVAAGFVLSLGKIAAIGNLASDPEFGNRSEAVEFLLDSLTNLAKNMGHEMAVVNTNLAKLVDRLKNRGFEVYDTGLVQMGKVL